MNKKTKEAKISPGRKSKRSNSSDSPRSKVNVPMLQLQISKIDENEQKKGLLSARKTNN